jgi:hypothetical protein
MPIVRATCKGLFQNKKHRVRLDLPSGLSNNLVFLINDIFNHNGKI